MSIANRTARTTASRLAEVLGWSARPDVTADAMCINGRQVIVTSGTGEGTFAYDASEVASWLEAREGARADYSEDFCGHGPSPLDEAPLAWAALREEGIALCRAGDCRRVLAGAEVEAGEGDEHDTGRILDVSGRRVQVGWDSGVRTWIDADDLRAR